MKSFIIAKKDLHSYFCSWLGILVFFFLFLMAGILFSVLITGYTRLSQEAIQDALQNYEGFRMTHYIFGSFYLNMGVVMIFFIPLITMRSFSEERNQQTTELLFTYPLSDFDIIWGKFMGLFLFILMLFIPMSGYLYMFLSMGGIVDWGPILCGLLGLFLLIGAFLSMGLYISSLTDNQVTSALVTFGSLILLWSLDWSEKMLDGRWAQLVKHFSPLNHYREFAFGVLDLSHLAYFLFFILYFLFLTLRSIETRNWKS